jgi:CheY-like chemotaxis protein
LTSDRRQLTLLIAEDDPDDRLLIRKAFAATGFELDLRIVGDGEELMEYLQRRGPHTKGVVPRPSLIVLDLNMPRKNGREALAAIKTDPDLQTIPVIVLTTSKTEEDVCHCYDLGANAYIVKPMTLAEMTHAMEILTTHWFDIVKLPPSRFENRL